MHTVKTKAKKKTHTSDGADTISPPIHLSLPTDKKLLLHLAPFSGSRGVLNPCFKGDNWHVVFLSDNPSLAPDVLADLTNLSALPEGIFDAVWLPHTLEFYQWNDINTILQGCLRTLKMDGLIMMQLYDAQALADYVADNVLETRVKTNKYLNASPLDLLYGDRKLLEKDERYQKKCAFTSTTITNRLVEAGFFKTSVQVKREYCMMIAKGFKVNMPESKKAEYKITGNFINLRERDEIDVEPTLWESPFKATV